MLDYFLLGHEQWVIKKNILARLFYFLFGHINTAIRMDHSHMIRAIKALHPHDGSKILDAGCGFGGCSLYLARTFRSCRIVGIDINHSDIDNCQFIANKYSMRNVSFFLQDLNTFESPPEYDIIYNSSVLEHIRDDADLLGRFFRALRPGGHLVVSVPHKEFRSILRRHTDVPEYVWELATPHVRDGYSEAELMKKMTNAGFTDTNLRYAQGTLGILSHELTLLFWKNRILNSLTTMLTFPVSLLFGYLDTVVHYRSGNFILLTARKPLNS